MKFRVLGSRLSLEVTALELREERERERERERAGGGGGGRGRGRTERPCTGQGHNPKNLNPGPYVVIS